MPVARQAGPTAWRAGGVWRPARRELTVARDMCQAERHADRGTSCGIVANYTTNPHGVIVDQRHGAGTSLPARRSRIDTRAGMRAHTRERAAQGRESSVLSGHPVHTVGLTGA